MMFKNTQGGWLGWLNKLPANRYASASSMAFPVYFRDGQFIVNGLF